MTPSVDRNNFHDVNIFFTSSENVEILPPDLFKLITFNEDVGLLNGFKIKGDAILFLEKIIMSLENNSKVNTTPSE